MLHIMYLPEEVSVCFKIKFAADKCKSKLCQPAFYFAYAATATASSSFSSIARRINAACHVAEGVDVYSTPLP